MTLSKDLTVTITEDDKTIHLQKHRLSDFRADEEFLVPNKPLMYKTFDNGDDLQVTLHPEGFTGIEGSIHDELVEKYFLADDQIVDPENK